MKVLDRLIFFLSAVGLLFFSCLLILFALNLIPWSSLASAMGRFYQSVAGREEIGIIGLLLFLAGIRLGQLSYSHNNRKGIVIQDTPLGKVKVSLVAAENLVHKLLKTIPEVKEAKPSIHPARGEVSVTLRIAIVPETNVPQLTARIQNLIKEGILDVLGIKVCQVKVLVDNMLAHTARVE